MRNPKRIYPIMQQIQTYWFANPDLRFGQLLENLQLKLKLEAAKEGIATDIFYLEDDKMSELLKKVLGE